MAFNGPIPVQLVDAAIPLTTTAIGPKTALDVANTKDTSVSTPSIQNILLVTPGTEYTTALPPYTKEFSIKARESGIIQFCYTSGQSGTNFVTIPTGSMFSKDSIYSASAINLFFQSTKANMTVEIMLWS